MDSRPTASMVSAFAAGTILAATSVLVPARGDPGGDSRVASTEFWEVCSPGYAPAHRNESYAGLPLKHGYQRDHRVSLSIGGADNAANIQYQPLNGPWNAHDKDKLEKEVWHRVCRLHTMELVSAQMAMSKNWCNLYVRVFGIEPLSAMEGKRPEDCSN